MSLSQETQHEMRMRRLLERRVAELTIECPDHTLVAGRARARRRNERAGLAAAALVVALAVLAGAVAMTHLRHGTDLSITGRPASPTPTDPSAVPIDADATQVVLPGWQNVYYRVRWPLTRQVVHSDLIEYQWTKGRLEVQLDYSAATEFMPVPAGAATTGTNPVPLPVRGHPADVIRYGGGRWLISWVEDGWEWTVDVRGFTSEAAVQSMIGSLSHTDHARWLASLPAGTVDIPQRPAAVDALLKGVPIPPGLDVAALRTANRVTMPHDLTFEVYGPIECAWSAQLVAHRGTRTGQTAAAALHSISQWPGYAVLDDQGGWRGVAVDEANQVIAGTTSMSMVRDALNC